MTGEMYLSGNYAPVREELSAVDLAVTGQLPDELEGRYLRNGPNPLGQPDPETYHWFTGEGMIHGVRLRAGRAEWYRNRWVRSDSVAAALGEDRRCGADAVGGMDFAANTNVISHAGRTLAIVEAGSRPYELTDDLETVGRYDFGGTLPAGYTAHPKRDPESGELHAISYYWGWGSKVQYTIVDGDGRVRRSEDIEVGGAVSVHDMSITSRWAVVYDLPVVFDLAAASSAGTFPYRWDPGYQARVGLVPKDGPTGTPPVWFEIEPCYVFHPLNAFDLGDQVVLDVVRHDHVFRDDVNGPSDAEPVPERWTLDPASGVVKQERLDDRPQEFPRVDERRVGRPYRYGYTTGAAWADSVSTVIRHDLERGKTEVRPIGPGTGASEPVFVARSQDAAEDDGWVLCLSYDAGRGASDLLVLNAADFTGDPQAVVHLPVRVPVGFHGNWVPDRREVPRAKTGPGGDPN
jgi:carotenoid cleavage dioxygenase